MVEERDLAGAREGELVVAEPIARHGVRAHRARASSNAWAR